MTRASVLGDLDGAVADLGVMVPLATALILVNGLDAGAVFLWAGLLVLASGLVFGIPFPVQPLKALTAVAVAQQLAPGVIHAAGLEIAAVLLVLALDRWRRERLARLFTKPIVRALQLGVGILLVMTAANLVLEPAGRVPRDAVRPVAARPRWQRRSSSCGGRRAPGGTRSRSCCSSSVSGIAVADRRAELVGARRSSLPSARAARRGRDFATALPLLVLPQLPLTFGNAVVAVSDVAQRFVRRGMRVA